MTTSSQNPPSRLCRPSRAERARSEGAGPAEDGWNSPHPEKVAPQAYLRANIHWRKTAAEFFCLFQGRAASRRLPQPRKWGAAARLPADFRSSWSFRRQPDRGAPFSFSA